MTQWIALTLSHRSFSLLALLYHALVITYKEACVCCNVISVVGKMVEVLARAGADVNYPHEVAAWCLVFVGISDFSVCCRVNFHYLPWWEGLRSRPPLRYVVRRQPVLAFRNF